MPAPIDCPICMDCIESTTKNCVTTECGHCFHTNCLMKSVAHNGFGCPYCRTVMAEQPEEDDDDEDSFWSDEDEDEEEMFNDYALRGLRFFFNNLNGEPHDEEDIAEEDQADESISDEEQVNNNIPSTEIVAQKLREQGVTFEQLVKMICALDHHGYDNHEEEAEEFEEKLHGMVEKIVADYKPESAQPAAQPSLDLEAQPKSVNVRLVEEYIK